MPTEIGRKSTSHTLGAWAFGEFGSAEFSLLLTRRPISCPPKSVKYRPPRLWAYGLGPHPVEAGPARFRPSTTKTVGTLAGLCGAVLGPSLTFHASGCADYRRFRAYRGRSHTGRPQYLAGSSVRFRGPTAESSCGAGLTSRSSADSRRVVVLRLLAHPLATPWRGGWVGRTTSVTSELPHPSRTPADSR